MTEDNTLPGIIIFAHGSSVNEANQGVHDLALRVQKGSPFHHVGAAFLELAQPDLNAAVAEAASAGLRRVIIIPYFLTEGIHLLRDLPNLVAPLKQKFPQLAIDIGQSLEGHPLMAAILLGRVQEVIEQSKKGP